MRKCVILLVLQQRSATKANTMHATIKKYVFANKQQAAALVQAIKQHASNLQAANACSFAATDAALQLQALQNFSTSSNVLQLFNTLVAQDTLAREAVFAAIVKHCAAQNNASVQKFTFAYINALLDNYSLQIHANAQQ